ncbi:MAG TPA: carboxypeptidase-like regulatory domain-containing protein [Myxococcaceae bacterium]|nr:carboxypeptidase-like regulatory domain-containing protein [Myxococcaceae bacterium]
MPESDQAIDKPAPRVKTKTSYPALSILDRALILGVAVTQFLIGHGRVWAKPFDWDRSIVWSYVTIAALVLAALALRHRLNLTSWLLHTVELVGIKFLLTATFLVGFLIATHPKAATPAAEVWQDSARPVETKARLKAKPKATVFAEGSLGEIEGRATRLDGTVVRAALVFISDGLNELVFEPPNQPVTLENTGTGFSPGLLAIQVGQPLVIRSADHQLHTVQMMKQDRSWVLNVPILGSGSGRTLEFDEAKGLVSVECKVHQARESQAYLAVLNHPFFALTDADGRFALSGVPRGRLTVSAFEPTAGQASAPVQLDGGKKISVSLQLRQR